MSLPINESKVKEEMVFVLTAINDALIVFEISVEPPGQHREALGHEQPAAGQRHIAYAIADRPGGGNI